jgi:hypothetical protein
MLEMTCITRGRGPPAGWITRAQLSCNGDHGADQAVVRDLSDRTESAATTTLPQLKTAGNATPHLPPHSDPGPSAISNLR